MIMSRWKKRLEMIRRGKDKYFRGSPQSPLTAEEREGFKGLVYYPIDPGYRFELELDEYDEKTPVRLEATHGEQRVVLRVGKFQFDIRNQECTLHAYQVGPLHRYNLGCRHARQGTVPRSRAGDTSNDCGKVDTRLQRSLQSVVRVRRRLQLPHRTAREPAERAGAGRGEELCQRVISTP
jgi:hypothetical protein